MMKVGRKEEDAGKAALCSCEEASTTFLSSARLLAAPLPAATLKDIPVATLKDKGDSIHFCFIRDCLPV